MEPDVVGEWLAVIFMALLVFGAAVAAVALGVGACVRWFDERRQLARKSMQDRH